MIVNMWKQTETKEAKLKDKGLQHKTQDTELIEVTKEPN